MRWLNYHHLLYFWVVAKKGTITAACEELRLAQPTISAQLRALEKDLGHKLFRRVGRNLVLTDSGRIVYRHAQEIFPVGQDLIDALEGRPTGAAVRLRVGVTDVFPKLLAYRFLVPAFTLPEPVHIICNEGNPALYWANWPLMNWTSSCPNPRSGRKFKYAPFITSSVSAGSRYLPRRAWRLPIDAGSLDRSMGPHSSYLRKTRHAVGR